MIPGECEDTEVGVDPLLQDHIPGDSEYLVEGLLAEANIGVGGGKLCVLTIVLRLASSLGPWIAGGSVLSGGPA